MREITLKSIISKNKDIDASDLDGQKVMMNIELGKYFMMNEVGSSIWDAIEKEKTVEAIVSGLISEYDVDRDSCLKSVIGYLEKMRDSNLIEVK